MRERLRDFFKELEITGGIHVNEDKKEEILQYLLSPGLIGLIEKMDITEEIERIDSHLSQFKKAIELGEPVGKRLDFLIQEIMREFNTIGAKSMNAELRSFVVEAKVELEKLRDRCRI